MKMNKGFTLVELSIVLVILGLLIGGVLTGQSLIRAAELRSVSTQYSRYMAAVQTFRDKYFALPGDMPNAVSYWGLASAGSCPTTTTNTAATCNGDGNGMIQSTGSSNELFRFWQQLANAGLIEGNYTGIQASGGTANMTNATNAPAGRIGGSYWFIYNWGTLSGWGGGMFDGVYNNSMEIGAATSTDWPSQPIFKPEEAYNIDVKTDDGKPATGKLVALAAGGLSTCTDASATSTLTANYLLSGSSKTCALTYRDQF